MDVRLRVSREGMGLRAGLPSAVVTRRACMHEC